MLVLIDESGCSGFKIEKGSTPYFVVAMVIFDNFKEAETTSALIETMRKALGVKPEFKFSKLSDDRKDQFFRAVTDRNFRVRALVVPKAALYSRKLRTDSDSFYNFFVKLLIKFDDGLLQNASIKIDGSGDREFKRSLDRYLRAQIGPGKIRKFRFVDSRSDNLIQLADMCVGAISRSYRPDARDHHDRWRRMLRKRIQNVWEFK